MGLLRIRRCAETIGMHHTQIILRVAMALHSGLAIPEDRLAIVLVLALAVEIHGAHRILRRWIILLCRHLVPVIGLFIVLRRALAVVVHCAHIVLGLRNTLLGRQRKQLHSLLEVLICT